MHPAGSVILFTVASGLGFGMLTWLGLGLPDFGLNLPFGKSAAILKGLLAMAQQLVEP